MAVLVKKLQEAGFIIDRAEEWRGQTTFYDVGALVYFLSNIPWVVQDFRVKKYQSQLEELQKQIAKEKQLDFSIERYLIVARK